MLLPGSYSNAFCVRYEVVRNNSITGMLLGQAFEHCPHPTHAVLMCAILVI